jgi:hypothetical protein
LKTANYDELTVDEISKRLNGLSTEELRKVREYEKRNKNRETLIEQIDRNIRATSKERSFEVNMRALAEPLALFSSWRAPGSPARASSRGSLTRSRNRLG